MSAMKIMDTCTMINIFICLDVDLSPCLKEYRTVVTDQVVSEYTRKHPRQIPECVSVVGMSERSKAIAEEMELLFPRLGSGEVSVFVLALEMASSGSKVVVLTDDKAATNKFSKMAKDINISSRFRGSENIIWGDTMSLIQKFADERRIPRSFVDKARTALMR